MFCAAGYFDESDDTERAYSVAGFLGHQKDCVYLDWAWRDRILNKYDLEYFKASELEAGAGQFRKFRDNPEGDPRELFSAREKNLFREIKTESINIFLDFDLLIGLGAVVMLPDYYRLFEEYKTIGKVLPAPYFFGAQLVMMESGFIMDALNHGIPKTQQGFVRPNFDSQEEYCGRTKLMFDTFAKKNPLCSKWLCPPHYESDKDYIVLQVADNLAYECRRLLITKEYSHLPERKAMTRFKERIYRIYKLNYEGLKMIMESQEPDIIPIKAEIENQIKGRSMKNSREYESFNRTMQDLMKVPHSEIKAKLDAEKRAKTKKRKAKKPSASGRA